MIVSFDGRREETSGDRPNSPVKWTGKFLVADAAGNKIEHLWYRDGAPPMDDQGARNFAGQTIARLKARLFEKHLQPIRTATYTLTSR